MFRYELDKQWIIDNIWAIGFTFMVVRSFLNNLLQNIPSLKSNKVFELLCNIMDAIIATAKDKLGGNKNEEIINLNRRIDG